MEDRVRASGPHLKGALLRERRHLCRSLARTALRSNKNCCTPAMTGKCEQ